MKFFFPSQFCLFLWHFMNVIMLKLSPLLPFFYVLYILLLLLLNLFLFYSSKWHHFEEIGMVICANLTEFPICINIATKLVKYEPITGGSSRRITSICIISTDNFKFSFRMQKVSNSIFIKYSITTFYLGLNINDV